MGTQRQGNVALDEFVIAGAAAAGLLSDSPGIDAISSTGRAALRILRIDGTGNALEWVAPSGGGANALGDLSDVDAAVDTGTGKLMIGDGAGLFKSQSMTGDVTITATGVTTISAGVITATELAAASVNSAKLSAAAVNNAALGLAAVEADNLSQTLKTFLAYLTTPSIGGEVANQIQFDYTPQAASGFDLGAQGMIIEARVTDTADSNEPSATAFFVEGTAGTMVGGINSATAVIKQTGAGHFIFKVEEPGAGTRYVSLRGGFGSKVYVRHLTGADSATFV